MKYSKNFKSRNNLKNLDSLSDNKLGKDSDSKCNAGLKEFDTNKTEKMHLGIAPKKERIEWQERNFIWVPV